MDEQEEYWHETNPAVVFITALQDLNQPYSCEEWGDRGIEGYPLIVEHPGTMFTWLSGSAPLSSSVSSSLSRELEEAT